MEVSGSPILLGHNSKSETQQVKIDEKKYREIP